MIALLSALGLTLAAPPPQDPSPEQQALDQVRAAFTGSFLGVERKDGREGQGHIVASALPGGFIGRDYWSEGGGRRLYAGHDVLELLVDGSARHWWFGSRGDEAYAEGRWTAEQLALYVLDDDGDRIRRYTYDLVREAAPAAEGDAPAAEPPLAFRFRNDHADGDGWEFFMGTDWRRAAARLPADFQPDEDDARGSWRQHYVGDWTGASGRHRGRWLFGDWLVLDTPREHAVLSKSWLGKFRLRSWGDDGRFRLLEGKEKRDRLRLRPVPGPGAPARRGAGGSAPDEAAVELRTDQWLPDGYRSEHRGRVLDFQRSGD